MLDGLLGRGFAPKCKSLIKTTKTRIDVIRRKRKATEKYLKKDIADLLANGLDINAYGRADGLLVELTLSSCYDFVEQSCDFVLNHLSMMQKQRECPEECRAAVSSLMFAAARFSDLPELRDLRQIFQERYENSLELSVNQKFVENLASKTSTLEKKVQLMQGIALEFSIKWDSRAFEMRMSKPSTYAQDQPKIYGSFNVAGDKNKSSSGMGAIPRGEKPDVSFKERLELTNDGHRYYNAQEGTVSKRELDNRSRHEFSDKGYKARNGREGAVLKKDGHDISFQGRQEFADDKHDAWNWKGDATPKSARSRSSSQGNGLECIDDGSRLLVCREDTAPVSDYAGSLLHRKPEFAPSCGGLQSKGNGKEPLAGNNHAIQHNITNLVGKVEEGIIHKEKPYYRNALPPPYVKPNVKPKASKSRSDLGSSPAGFDSNVAFVEPSILKRANVGSTSERIQLGSNHSDYERQVVGPARVNSHGQEKDHFYQDDVAGNSTPKPRSSRRRRSKSRHNNNDAGYFEEIGVVTRKSRSKERDNSRRGLQVLFDDEHYQDDEEERKLDKLLMKYSKKPSPYEPAVVRGKSKARHADHMGANAGESPQNSRGGPDEKSEMVPPPPRSVSLPHEHTSQTQATKVFSRAASLQPARHVHPKLPDYDDLAERFAALRGR
ncbi:hypothetical protein FH972_003260 [Carpinus fangiana]|uniref:IST1-like protein n=1 Tax=Carpinus fangiana TaxID=176857 RepID=A0A5N6QJC0_9ROSI|nr:hypothetical protein FH972_003260 [Carpinus fangiana]